jgi:hypothetical protein
VVFGRFDSQVPLRRDGRVPKDGRAPQVHVRGSPCRRSTRRRRRSPRAHARSAGGGGNLCALIEGGITTGGRSGSETPVRDVPLSRVLRNESGEVVDTGVVWLRR